MEAMEIIVTVGAAVAGGLVTFAAGKNSREAHITTLQATVGNKNREIEELKRQRTAETEELKKARARVESELAACRARLTGAQKLADRYGQVKSRLEASSVVHSLAQPVVLVGPRFVGKSSLLMQWHAPWNHSPLLPTPERRTAEVPVHDFQSDRREPHFADPEISVPVTVHLKLKVHDFPGELAMQSAVRSTIVDETAALREATSLNLGVVLICMFDASEAIGTVSRTTQEYYNGELFQNLRGLVAHSKVHIDRLILVFNKFDLYRAQRGGSHSTEDLQRECIGKLSSLYGLLRGAINPERVCEVFTILDRERMAQNNQGALIVLGEAARHFVEGVAGRQTAKEILKADATRFAAEYF